MPYKKWKEISDLVCKTTNGNSQGTNSQQKVPFELKDNSKHSICLAYPPSFLSSLCAISVDGKRFDICATWVILQSLERIRSPSFGRKKRVHFELPKSENGDMDPEIRKELADLIEAKEAGVAYVMGHSYVKAKKSSSFLKKLAINVVYTFLRRNCRDPAMTLSIPHISLIEVGMIYYV